MLPDVEIIPICERYAKIFLRQATKASHIGPDAYNEIYNEAYVIAKACKELRSVATSIKWGLINYIGLPCKKDSNDPNKDRRKISFLRENVDRITADIILETKEKQELLMKAVEKLSNTEKHILNSYFYADLSLKEIAIIQKCSFQRISQIIKQTLEKLRREIDVKI